MSANEVWREIPGLEHYQVSNLGRVKSLARTIVRCDGVRRNLPERILTLHTDSSGYRQVRAARKLWLVHSLVLTAFVSARPVGMYGCHNNGDKVDNRLENLRWDTPKNNVADRILHGTYQFGERNPGARISDEVIERIRCAELKHREIAELYGISEGYVSRIKSGHARRVGRFWQVKRVDVS